MCMETWNNWHGDPKDNNEVSIASQLSSFLLGFGPWAENLEEKGKIWAFMPSSPCRS